jgi:16S rRNA (guanine(966)-N(2))-methyltransferase RsmD
MRVIAGQFRSRKLHSFPGMEVRPTADRVRESLFNVLESGFPDRLHGTAWLDLYAGTGAVGIEALSRGARHATFVETSRRVAALIEKNLAGLGIPAVQYEVAVGKATAMLQKLATLEFAFDYCFLDPPYSMHEEYAAVLERLAESRLLTPAAIIIAEHHPKFDPGARVGKLERFRLLRQGDAALSFYHRA